MSIACNAEAEKMELDTFAVWTAAVEVGQDFVVSEVYEHELYDVS